MHVVRTNFRHCEAQVENRLPFIQLSINASPKRNLQQGVSCRYHSYADDQMLPAVEDSLQSPCSYGEVKSFSNCCKNPFWLVSEMRLLRRLSSAKSMRTLLSVDLFYYAPRNDERSNQNMFGGVGYAI